MKHGHWLIYVVTPTAAADKKVRLPRLFSSLFVGLALLGMAGFARSLWFVASYGYAKIGVHSLERENRNLQKTVQFLEKFAESKEHEIQRLTSFEDMARLKFGMNTVSSDVRQAGVGGAPTTEDLLLASLEDPPVRRASLVQARIESLFRQVALQDSTFSRMADHVSNQHRLWAQRPSIWPVHGRITSGYGYRIHPFFGRNMFHEGIDIANRPWTPVAATAEGLVGRVFYSQEYGNTVRLEHPGSGVSTMYAHLRQTAVVEGQYVKRGEIVGYLGNTGRSTGPHLHYEIRIHDRHTNPMDFILPATAVID
jgi:hypothetical protein